jgi:hypothetical protein
LRTQLLFILGAKAVFVRKILVHVELLRECCGGYGFLKFSGFPEILERILTLYSFNNNQDEYIKAIALFMVEKLDGFSKKQKSKFVTNYMQYSWSESLLEKVKDE